jgi:hypothetical protein
MADRQGAGAPSSFLQLPDMLSVASTAAACREAWTTFVERSQEWGKADLVMWTYGALAPLTRTAEEALSSRIGGPASVDHEFARIDVLFVDRLVRTARARVLDTLWSLESSEARVDFGYAMLSTGAVLPCEDAHGGQGFVPSCTRGPLAERVLALVAADLLTAPGDFEQAVLCADCGRVGIGPRPCCTSSQVRYAAGKSDTLRAAR